MAIEQISLRNNDESTLHAEEESHEEIDYSALLPHERIKAYDALILRQRERYKEAVCRYQPAAEGSVHNLQSPLGKILRGLPGVVNVHVHPSVQIPDWRIIHIKNWHYIPRDLFALELRHYRERPLTDEEIECEYRIFLKEVELVQIEQSAMLECLIRRHGLQSVYLEGVTNENLLFIRGKAMALATPLPSDTENLLQIGAAGKLFAQRSLQKLHALDDEVIFSKASPVDKKGKLRTVPMEIHRKRLDKQLEHLYRDDSSVCHTVILGGMNDLGSRVEQLFHGSCECFTVTTHWYKNLAQSL